MKKILLILSLLLLTFSVACVSKTSNKTTTKAKLPKQEEVKTDTYVNKEVYKQPEDEVHNLPKPKLKPSEPVNRPPLLLNFDDFYERYNKKTVTKEDVILSLGNPSLITQEANNQFWRYDTDNCHLSLFWLGNTLADVSAYSYEIKEYNKSSCYKDLYRANESSTS